ncbi:MAG: hypothetical protein J6B28_05015 [Eubacterium sp.]|nr:hypothetical protein [Eubacterium sp.]
MHQMHQMTYPFMYPYPDVYMNEVETERDLQYLQQMYPTDAKEMQKKVKETCDKLEYEGSMMYDEYPDRMTMLLICDRIADELMREEEASQTQQQMELPQEVQTMQMRTHRRSLDKGRRSLLEVLLYNEMHKRRCKRRQCRRFW